VKRRRLVWIVAVLVLLLGAGAALAAPWLACRWLAGQCPLPADGWLVVAGAGFRGGPAAPPVTVRASPAAVAAVASGAARTHLPGVLFATGQRAWGEFAGGTPWLLTVDAAVPHPRLDAHLTPLQADALLARASQGQSWGATLTRLTLEDLGGPGPERHFLLRAAGAVRGEMLAGLGRFGVTVGMWVPVRELEAELTLRPGPGPGALRVAVRRVEVALPGISMVAAPLAQRTINRVCDERLAEGLPDWLPWDAEISVAVAGGTVDQ
jgi:hypothetical protein